MDLKEREVHGVMFLDEGAKKCMPKEGLKGPQKELFASAIDKERWMCILKFEGEEPWFPGSERKVSLLFLSDDFTNFVQENKPNLEITCGSTVVGYFHPER